MDAFIRRRRSYLLYTDNLTSVFVIGRLLVLQLIDQSANKLLRDPFGYARRQVLEKFLEGRRRARVTQHADRLDGAKQNLRRRFFERIGERLQRSFVAATPQEIWSTMSNSWQ